jgi:hypothetical protein
MIRAGVPLPPLCRRFSYAAKGVLPLSALNRNLLISRTGAAFSGFATDSP